MNTAIVGASGYTGEMLVKLLSFHPRAKLVSVTSRSRAGKSVASVIPSLRGVLDDMVFDHSDPNLIAQREDLECVFLAVPHGTASEYAKSIVESGKKVIDLSADFRIANSATYEEFYGEPHPEPELLKLARYVLPEIVAAGWQESPLIACPGCYPTSVLIPLFPLLKAGVIRKEGIVVNSFSGVSGAGKQAKETYSYCEVNENAKAYGIPKHRHLPEIEEQLGLAGQGAVVLQFNPHLAPMSRGIITTITVSAGSSSIDALYEAWQDRYGSRPFVQILDRHERPETKHVVGTNRIDISAVKDPRTGNFVITSAEDNLMKGVSGQAVQIMNLWHGWDEATGLIHG